MLERMGLSNTGSNSHSGNRSSYSYSLKKSESPFKAFSCFNESEYLRLPPSRNHHSNQKSSSNKNYEILERLREIEGEKTEME